MSAMPGVIPVFTAFMNTQTMNMNPLPGTVANAADSTHIPARKTKPLPDISTMKAHNRFATKTGHYYVKTPEEDARYPFADHAACGVKTLEKARVLAEELSCSTGQKWHQIIRVSGAFGLFEMHIRIAEHRAGFGWMTCETEVSSSESLIDWDTLDPSASDSDIEKLHYAALRSHAVVCPRCRSLVYPPFERP